MSLQQVHLRINDAATGQPTPVSLRVTDREGNYYPPHGRPAEFATGRGEDVGGNLLLGRERWAYIDGSCEITLPPGELTIEAAKGPEYRPLRETVHLPPGKLALRFNIERWIDLRKDGWYSGDARAHDLSPHAALLEAAAEGLEIINLLARETRLSSFDGQSYQSFPNLLAFSGQQPCLERDGRQVIVNTHNAHPVLGKLSLLHCHRVVYPLSFGGPDHSDDWSLVDWCGQCHRKRGLVVWSDAFNPAVNHAGEALAAVILGQIDAMEFDSLRLPAWYQLLNAGFHAPIVGASGKESNRTPLGLWRTYAQCETSEPFTYAAWIEAIRAGRTFVSAGPIVTLETAGGGPGAKITIEQEQPPIRYGARSLEPPERVELIANGSVVATGAGEEQEHQLSLPTGGWIAVRCWSGGRHLAHSSPIYLASESGAARVDPRAIHKLDQHLVRARDWVATEGRCTNPKSRDRLLGNFDAARQVLLERSRMSVTIVGPDLPSE